MRETLKPTRGGLDSGVGDFASIFRPIKSKNSLHLVVVDVSLDSHGIRIKMLNVLYISENKSFILIKTTSNDIFSIF